MNRPELSVAIIFKNEIRCLERCLKSIQRLKERVSCELVMADTGATDGSRAVAERYADVLIDFPWINDFAAARNAVLDRCTGRWVLTIDCDEWLEDTDGLIRFLGDRLSETYEAAAVIQRNYYTAALENYGDVLVTRMMRMAAKPRYRGAIHEYPTFPIPDADIKVTALQSLILQHDGYVMLNDGSEEGAAKRRRNLEPIRRDLAERPDDLRVLTQFIETASGEPDFLEVLNRAVLLAAEAGEERGAALLRDAVRWAYLNDGSECEDWARLARERYSDSPYTRIDIAFLMFGYYFDKRDFQQAVECGEAYLRAYRAYRRNDKAVLRLAVGVLSYANEYSAQECAVQLSTAYRKLGDGERAYAKLKGIDWTALNPRTTHMALASIVRLYMEFGCEVTLLMRAMWDGINVEKPTPEKAAARRAAFLEGAEGLLHLVRTGAEEGVPDRRPADVLIPLAGYCAPGNMAALARAETVEDTDNLLAAIEDPTRIPDATFVHALKLGAEFPIPDKVLTPDQMASLAGKLASDPPFLREAAKFAASAAQTEQEVMWAYALARTVLHISGVDMADAKSQPKAEEP